MCKNDKFYGVNINLVNNFINMNEQKDIRKLLITNYSKLFNFSPNNIHLKMIYLFIFPFTCLLFNFIFFLFNITISYFKQLDLLIQINIIITQNNQFTNQLLIPRQILFQKQKI